MKFCVDCKFYNPKKQDCIREGKLDLVTGETLYPSAYIPRSGTTANDCGVNAQFFSPLPAPTPLPTGADPF